MENDFEAAPYIQTIGDEVAKNNLYLQFFDVKHLGNLKGAMPIFGVDFHETNEAYANRLKIWKFADKEVLFDGWVVKDMKHWQFLHYGENVTVIFEFNTYSITAFGKEYKFSVLPDTIDDFINDCKRIGLKLFWKPEIIDKFGIEKITSEKKTERRKKTNDKKQFTK